MKRQYKKGKRIYRKGIPFDLYPTNDTTGFIGYAEVPVIKSMAGMQRYIKRFDISEDTIFESFQKQQTIEAQMSLRRKQWLEDIKHMRKK